MLSSRRLSIWLTLFCITFTMARSQTHATVVADSVYSARTAGHLKFNVLLPAGYREGHGHYVTLYLLHGFGGGPNDWIAHSGLVTYAAAYPFIIITPDAKNSWYTNAPDRKSNYEDCIIKGLIPYVDEKYRTMHTRHGRAIAGLSMGGYGAMKFAVKYPQLFFYGASFSGALYAPLGYRPDNSAISRSLHAAFGEKRSDHWTRNNVITLLDSVPTAALPYLYISNGARDSFPRIIENNRELAEKLRSKDALYEYHELPGAHNWTFWDKEIATLLQKLSTFDRSKP